MKAVHPCIPLLLFIMVSCGMNPVFGAKDAESSEVLIRQKRDEEPQYLDEMYWSGEQDRWPTLDEYSGKRRRSSKRANSILDNEERLEHLGRREDLEGNVIYGTSPLETRKRTGAHISPEEDKEYILKRENIEKSLYDLLSSKSQFPTERRNKDDLNDLYLAAELLKRHRVPRGLDDSPHKVVSGRENDIQQLSDKRVQRNDRFGKDVIQS
ncbi:uncharacterized protein LOC128503742 [Spea bombifrons]|uniref:uncharacterized protein LOC128503742 n=1 Tax=Spea bombifrons TaxID=233779 RepID=UPI00234A8302|nr:uncharacterized protein LOC128503742 [Spea bombifrons]